VLLAGLAFAAGQVLLLAAGTRDTADAVPAAAASLAWYIAALMGLLLAWAWRSTGGLPSPAAALATGGLWAGLVLASLALMAPSVGDAAYKEGRLGWQNPVQGLREAGEQGKALSFLDRARDRYALARRLAPWEPAYALAAGRAAVERADLLDEAVGRALAEAGRDRLADEYDPALSAVADRTAERDAAFAAGLAAIDRASQLMPGSPEPLVTRAFALRLWGDRTRAAERRAERLADALRQFDAAAARAPGWPEVLDEAGATAILAGDPAEALNRSRQALALDPYFRRAWRTAAAAQVELGDLPAAVDAYAEYFVDFRNAGDVAAQRARLALLTRLGRDAEALAVARTVAEQAQGDARAWADLAVLQERTGDAAGAQSSAQRAAGLAPGDAGIAALVRRLGIGPAP
jgi:tetratricopeptide (TPR) repeat protein